MKVQFTETVVRDAQQSLIATRMPFSDFEDILETMDNAGYHSIECWEEQHLIPACDSWMRIRGRDFVRLRQFVRRPPCRCCSEDRISSDISIIPMMS